MNRREYHIGPGAASLLLVIVVVSMSVLGMLELMNARSDAALADRSARFTTSEYEESAQAERQLAGLDAVLIECLNGAEDDAQYLEAVAAALPEGMELSGRTVTWYVEADVGRRLNCAVELTTPGTAERYVWRSHKFVAQSTEDFFE